MKEVNVPEKIWKVFKELNNNCYLIKTYSYEDEVLELVLHDNRNASYEDVLKDYIDANGIVSVLGERFAYQDSLRIQFDGDEYKITVSIFLEHILR